MDKQVSRFGWALRDRPYGHGGDIWTASEQAETTLLDVSANTNPLGASPAALAAAQAALAASDRYPDPRCRVLVSALARHEGVPEETVVCGNGAAELIWRIVAARRPRRVLVTAPTFSEYALAAQHVGADVIEIPLDARNGFELGDAFVGAVDASFDMVFVCTPNNPTGRTIAPEVLDRLVERCRAAGALLVVDECFLGFVAHGDARSLVRRAARTRGVVVLKAFTKLYGMAGLRLGWMVTGDAGLMGGVIEAGPPWSVSTPAQAAGVAALADETFVERTCSLVAQERPWLKRELSSLGAMVVPGEANYLLLRTPFFDIAARMRAHGVLVRDCSDFSGLGAQWCRVAVRTHGENLELLQAFTCVFADANGCGAVTRGGDAV